VKGKREWRAGIFSESIEKVQRKSFADGPSKDPEVHLNVLGDPFENISFRGDF
jgi:hypothetical protein